MARDRVLSPEDIRTFRRGVSNALDAVGDPDRLTLRPIVNGEWPR
jgi:hypothetical protein